MDFAVPEVTTAEIAAAFLQATVTLGLAVAGDCRSGQSLVVRAIAEGREAARAVNRHLVDRSISTITGTQPTA